jgi:hypothetical protein
LCAFRSWVIVAPSGTSLGCPFTLMVTVLSLVRPDDSTELVEVRYTFFCLRIITEAIAVLLALLRCK